MDTMEERDDQTGDKSHALGIILALARALRSEFGVGIDAHPGGVSNEAGAINRAFRIAAWVILKQAGSLEDDPATVLTSVLRQTAHRRLHELGVSGQPAEALLDMES